MFLRFPLEIRKIVYTTNVIDSLNPRIRQAARSDPLSDPPCSAASGSRMPKNPTHREDGHDVRELITFWLAALDDEPSERASTERRDGRLASYRERGRPHRRPGAPSEMPGQTAFVSSLRASRRGLMETSRPDPPETRKTRRTSRSDALRGGLKNGHTLNMRGHRKEVDLSRVYKSPGQIRFFARCPA
ncbi:hypothetical protein ABZ402_05910 [Streptomyces mirabilis]|uniref:hypothetical protein n=1 Tax=Streptomyces mirabilis TaxID=68239 RepID=UPI0033D9A2DD